MIDMTLQRPTGAIYHVKCMRHAFHEYDKTKPSTWAPP